MIELLRGCGSSLRGHHGCCDIARPRAIFEFAHRVCVLKNDRHFLTLHAERDTKRRAIDRRPADLCAIGTEDRAATERATDEDDAPLADVRENDVAAALADLFSESAHVLFKPRLSRFRFHRKRLAVRILRRGVARSERSDRCGENDHGKRGRCEEFHSARRRVMVGGNNAKRV